MEKKFITPIGFFSHHFSEMGYDVLPSEAPKTEEEWEEEMKSILRIDISLFEELNKSHAEFCKKHFSGITDFKGPLKHLQKEVKEAIDSGEEEEFADMQLLLLSAFRLRFPNKNTIDLIEMCFEKLAACENREWGAVNEDGFIEHKR